MSWSAVLRREPALNADDQGEQFAQPSLGSRDEVEAVIAVAVAENLPGVGYSYDREFVVELAADALYMRLTFEGAPEVDRILVYADGGDGAIEAARVLERALGVTMTDWREEPDDGAAGEAGFPESGAARPVRSDLSGLTFYKTCSTKLSLGEYWRLSPNVLVFLFMAVMKMLRARVDLGGGVPMVKELTFLDERDLPLHAHGQLSRYYTECQRLGMSEGFYYTIPVLGRGKETFGAALRSDDGLVAASLAYARQVTTAEVMDEVQEIAQEQCVFGFYTPLRDGAFLGTMGGPRQLDSPPHWLGEYWPRKDVATVYARHRERLKALQARQPAPIPRGGLAAFVVDMTRRETEYHVRRGAYEPMTRDEVEALLEEAE